MLIRPFEARDVAAACRLTNYYIEHTCVHFATVPQGDAEFGAAWEAARATHPWLAAEAGGEVGGVFAGYAKAGVWRSRDAYSRTAETSIYVESAFHRRGVARALYAALLEALRARGFHAAVGGMVLPNDASARLHEAMGFRPVGIFHEVGRKFDQWHDTQWWEKIL